MSECPQERGKHLQALHALNMKKRNKAKRGSPEFGIPLFIASQENSIVRPES
jgi:hypothetical protein